MPVRNLTRFFTDNSYYHVYNRGVNKRKIFLDEEDYLFFTNLFHRYIDRKPTQDSKGRDYRWLGDQVELVAYCLMPNHFHLLVYQHTVQATTDLLLSIGTAYTMYFNKKYKRRGPLFESTYKASMITNDAYLQHVSRYIHLNHKNFNKWPYSSLSSYLHPGVTPGYLHPERVTEQFRDTREYAEFVNDYEAMQRELEHIKHELADQ
jgi:putative transposase